MIKYQDTTLERIILRGMIHSEAILSEIIQRGDFGEGIFAENINKGLYRLYVDHFKAHGVIPPLNVVKNNLQKYFGKSKLYTKEQQREKANLLLDKLQDTPLNSKEMKSLSIVVAQLIEMKKARLIQQVIVEAADHLDNRDVDAAESIMSGYKYDVAASDDFTDEGDYVEDMQKRYDLMILKKEHPELFKCIPTGLMGYNPFHPFKEGEGSASLDMFLDGGFYRGELALVIGDSGAGKSFELMQFAYNAALTGHKVGFFTIEMSKWKQQTRLDSRISGIPFRDFKMATLSKEQIAKWHEKVDKFAKHGGSIYVTGFPRGCTVQNIEAKAKEIEDKNGGLDIIIIDYLNDIKPRKGGFITDVNWEAQGDISKELRQMALSWNMNKGIPIVTANQGKTTSALNSFKMTDQGLPKFKRVVWSDAAFSPLPPQHSSIVIGLLHAKDEETGYASMINHQIAKNRDGDTSFGVLTFPNLAMCNLSSKLAYERARQKWNEKGGVDPIETENIDLT